MPKLPLGFATLVLFLTAGSAFSSETRSIQPTQEELESFELPRPAPDVLASRGDSVWFEASGVGIFAASAADFATTEWGLSRGLQEGNPIASHRGIRLVHHVVGPAAVYWATDRLEKKGKTKLALALRIAVMTAYSYAALHNAGHVSGVTVTR